MAKVVLICFHLIIGQNAIDCTGRVRKFPKTLLFGASSSAYQIEGGYMENGAQGTLAYVASVGLHFASIDGWNDITPVLQCINCKGPSIWDVTTHQKPSPIEDDSNGDVAADSYHLYKRDVEMIKELGLDFYRFSISWSRIYPHGFPYLVNKHAIEYYNSLIDLLIEKKVKPFVTMYHSDMPWNLQVVGGWTNPNIIEWFIDYAKILFEKFGDRVKFWVTVNDPKKTCNDPYGAETRVPFANTTGITVYLCAKNLLLAHAKVYHLYDEEFRSQQHGSVGISINHNWYEPASETMDDYQAAVDARQFEWGQFAHPIFSKSGDYPHEMRQNVGAKSAEQGYPRSRLPELTSLEAAMIRGSADFLGMNSYTSRLTYRDASLDGLYPVPSFKDDMSAVLVKDQAWHQSALPWLQDVPWGFFKVLIEVKNLYGNPPIYVLENGWATKGGLLDDDRIRYLRGYLNAMLDAIDEGCDIRGYAVWSLMDNFEWLHGYKTKFGLYEVDFASNDKTRTPRKSAFIYKEMIRSRTLDPLYEPETFILDTPAFSE